MPRSVSPDHYELLGVARDADAETIRRAYRRLARVSHPDSGGNAALFRLLQDAYETLHDPVRRGAYDRGLARGEPAGPDRDRPGPEPPSGTGGGTGGGTGREPPPRRERRPPEEEPPPSGPRDGSGRDGTAWDGGGSWTLPDGSSRSAVFDPRTLTWWDGLREDTPARIVPPYRHGWRAAAVAAAVLLALSAALVVRDPLVAGVAVLAAAGLVGWAYRHGTGRPSVPAVPLATGLVAVVALVVVGLGAHVTWVLGAAALWLAALVTTAVLAYRFGRTIALDRILPATTAGMVEYGRPGATAATDEDVLAAQIGADALWLLTALPGVRVVHGLDHGADHAVAAGPLVAVVQTRRVPPGRYAWTPHGSLLHDGRHLGGRPLRTGDTVTAYRRLLGRDREVRGFVLLVPDRPAGALTGTALTGGAGPDGLVAGDPKAVVEAVGGWFLTAGHAATADRRLLVDLLGQVAVEPGSM